jgi:hypothetical protein
MPLKTTPYQPGPYQFRLFRLFTLSPRRLLTCVAPTLASFVWLNLGGLLGAAVGSGRVHNIMEIDLSFLAGVQDDVYFSYTMECGNDSLKGLYSGGFDSVPDGATSILLIALGLVSMAVFGSKRRKA